MRAAGGEAKVPVERFRIKLPYREDRPDIPWIFVKLELAKVARSTSVAAEVSPLVQMEGMGELRPIVLTESAAEIVADKVISFTSTTSWLHIRDLFDMYWLLTRERVDEVEVRELTQHKLEDYALQGDALLVNLARRDEELGGANASIKALSTLVPMLVNPDWAQRIATPRGALALVGKSLDVCRKSLAQYSPT